MHTAIALAIARDAVFLQRKRPDMTAQQVLDVVMRNRPTAGYNFGPVAVGELLDPAGPFGTLLAAAFDGQGEDGCRVAAAFVRRYGLT